MLSWFAIGSAVSGLLGSFVFSGLWALLSSWEPMATWVPSMLADSWLGWELDKRLSSDLCILRRL